MTALLSLALLLLSPQTPLPGTITGRILNPDGSPAAGVRVGVMDPSNTPASDEPVLLDFTRTDNDGRYRLEGLAPGRYYIFAGPLDLPTYHPGTIERSGAASITIAAGASARVDFSLAQATLGFKVRGRVVQHGSEARPLSPQDVRIRPVSSTGSRLSSAVASDGTFELRGVMPGDYIIWLMFPPSGSQPRMISVRNHDLQDVDLVIPRVIDIQGIVISEDRRALPKVAVTVAPGRFRDIFAAANEVAALSQLDDVGPGGFFGELVLIPQHPFSRSVDGPQESLSVINTAETEPGGLFHLRLPEGSYRLVFSNVPTGYYFKSALAGSTDLLSEALTLTADMAPVRIAAVLARATPVGVSGRIAAGSSSALPSGVTLTNNLSSQLVEAAVRPDGTFAFSGVMPGKYHATLTLKSGMRVSAGSVTVREGGTSGMEIIAPPMREIRGHVTVEGGGPLTEFKLLLSRDLPPELKNPNFLARFLVGIQLSPDMVLNRLGSSLADLIVVSISPLPDGTFQFALSEGEYQVVFVDPAFFTLGADTPVVNKLRSLSYGNADLDTEPMRVSRRDSAELGVTLTPTRGWFKVSGHVSGLDPNRQRGARVLLDDGQIAALEVPVAADGSFTFDKVTSGRYRARVVPGQPSDPRTPIVVVDRDVTNVEIAVPTLREVRGRVVVEGQGPIVGLSLQLMTPISDSAEPAGPVQFSRTGAEVQISAVIPALVNPGPDGTFRFMAPDGEFKVQAGELPAGYDIRSLSWGNTDLLLEPLKIRGTTSSLELRVVLGVKPGAPSVKVSGRVSGAGVGADARITLTGVSMTARFEARLVNGAFEFPKVLPGVYMAAVARNGETFPVTSALVAVAVKDRIGIELVAGPTSMDANPQADAPGKATGAAIVDAFATVPDEMASMKPTHNESEAIANLRMINTAEVTYLATNGGKYGDIPALIAAGLLGSRFKEGFSGYIYTVSAFEGDYIAAAVPQDPKAGRYAFYSTPDAVVRFASSESLAPPGWATMPVQ